MIWWRGLPIIWLCLSALLLFGAPDRASASTIAVTSLGDDTAINGNCTLREAILAANRDTAVDACPAGAGFDTITVPAGTIILALEGTLENAGLTGDLDIWTEMKITGAGRDITIIDANGIDRVFDVGEVDQGVVEISDLTIRGGLLGSNLYPYEGEEHIADGAGVRINYYSTTLRLIRVWLADNVSDDIGGGGGHGAGIYAGGRLEMTGSHISGNKAYRIGGGIYAVREMLLDGVHFWDNYGYGDAAIYLSEGASAHVYRSTFTDNYCGPAGWMITVKRNASLDMDDFLVERSECVEAIIKNEGRLTLTSGTFRGNNPAGSGTSAIIMQRDGDLQVHNVHFFRNNSDAAVLVTGGDARIEETLANENSGAGLLVTGGAVRFINSTISTSTSSTDYSAGVQVEDGFLEIESVTLANLQSDQAALQVNGGSVIVHNALIAYNRMPSGQLRDCALAPSTTVSAGYNLVSVSDGCGWKTATGDMLGTGATPLDPRLDMLSDNGPGRTSTQPLLPGSPAIDAAEPGDCPPADQRGVERPQGPRCDIGAHEVVQGTPIYLPVVQR